MDDERYTLEMLSEWLESKSYKVSSALNGIEALKLLEKEEIDIVLTDIVMPQMDGIELLREIKTNYPNVEVIILTGYATIESHVDCTKMGVFIYKAKPLGLNELLQNIERCVQHISFKKENPLKAENLELKKKVDILFAYLTKPYSLYKVLQNIERCVKHINLKKENPLKVENIELKKKVDILTEIIDNRLKRASQQRIKDHPESMTLSEFGELVAGITHSLTTEIGIINSTSEGLLAKKAEGYPDIKRYKRLLRSAKYSNVLLNNLRDLLLEGKQDLTSLDINEVLNDVFTLFEFRIPSNVKLKTEISSKLPKLIIDKGQIEQVLVNTINNALEAMPEGGELSIKAKKKKTNLYIEINDTGVGIPKKNLKKVFQLYFSTKKRGAGLGLYLTKRIVERYNGSISLKSQEGKGTIILINLPINEEK